MAIKLLKILEDVSRLLLAVLYGDPDACVADMGKGKGGFADADPELRVWDLLKVPISDSDIR